MPPQEILTKDSVTVAVDAVVYWRIFNPTMSVTNVADAPRSTKLLAATSLRLVCYTTYAMTLMLVSLGFSGPAWLSVFTVYGHFGICRYVISLIHFNPLKSLIPAYFNGLKSFILLILIL